MMIDTQIEIEGVSFYVSSIKQKLQDVVLYRSQRQAEQLKVGIACLMDGEDVFVIKDSQFEECTLEKEKCIYSSDVG